ncbi:unnamed protein product [Amoebophrya sp. A120]|nr:unnamed protein product [Amoebophrya sp. A120]|eukprot:GSA120T00019278001.1
MADLGVHPERGPYDRRSEEVENLLAPSPGSSSGEESRRAGDDLPLPGGHTVGSRDLMSLGEAVARLEELEEHCGVLEREAAVVRGEVSRIRSAISGAITGQQQPPPDSPSSDLSSTPESLAGRRNFAANNSGSTSSGSSRGEGKGRMQCLCWTLLLAFVFVVFVTIADGVAHPSVQQGQWFWTPSRLVLGNPPKESGVLNSTRGEVRPQPADSNSSTRQPVQAANARATFGSAMRKTCGLHDHLLLAQDTDLTAGVAALAGTLVAVRNELTQLARDFASFKTSRIDDIAELTRKMREFIFSQKNANVTEQASTVAFGETLATYILGLTG